jgi:hypothetical protein
MDSRNDRYGMSAVGPGAMRVTTGARKSDRALVRTFASSACCISRRVTSLASQPYDRRNVGIAVNIRPTPPLTKSVSSRSCVMFLRPERSDPSSKYLRT